MPSQHMLYSLCRAYGCSPQEIEEEEGCIGDKALDTYDGQPINYVSLPFCGMPGQASLVVLKCIILIWQVHILKCIILIWQVHILKCIILIWQVHILKCIILIWQVHMGHTFEQPFGMAACTWLGLLAPGLYPKRTICEAQALLATPCCRSVRAVPCTL